MPKQIERFYLYLQSDSIIQIYEVKIIVGNFYVEKYLKIFLSQFNFIMQLIF